MTLTFLGFIRRGGEAAGLFEIDWNDLPTFTAETVGKPLFLDPVLREQAKGLGESSMDDWICCELRILTVANGRAKVEAIYRP